MIGYDTVHSSDFIYDVQPDHGYYLLILTQTPARFWIGDHTKIIAAGNAALFPPQARIRYGACESEYRNDWIIFSSDEAYVTEFPVLSEPFPVIDTEYCHTLFKLLTWEHVKDNYETTISQLMSILLTKLRSDLSLYQKNDHYNSELLTLRKQIASHPGNEWNIAVMADRMHISPGYLQTLYKQTFGISCMDDVIRSRIRLAGDYLTHTTMRISEIADLCGYHSTEHFCRQFRKITRTTPGEFRNRETIRMHVTANT